MSKDSSESENNGSVIYSGFLCKKDLIYENALSRRFCHHVAWLLFAKTDQACC